MFNLVGKRYLFLIISLIVIVPGAISLIFRGLNVGIDFAGGTNIEFRPRTSLTAAQITTLVKPLNLASLQVVLGNDTAVPGNQNVWVRLNTRIDTTTQKAIVQLLQAKYGTGISVTFDDLTLSPLSGKGKPTTVTVVSITKFASGNVPTIKDPLKNDIAQTVLSSKNKSLIPDTSNPSLGPATTPTPTTTPTTAATPTSTPKTTPTPKSTPKPTPTSTPVLTISPTVTATVGNNPSSIPVKVDAVYQGSVPETFTLLTLSVVDSSTLAQIEALFVNNHANYVYVLDNATVSGSVAAETTRNAFLAVVAASVFILLYIWFAFRKVARPWRYGACAIIALLHDVLVVLGVFSILGWTLHVQVDALFITALLTVVGFSVHDTIVVFDRIRENMTHRTSETFEQVVNASLVQTMARSLNTSLTVLITLSALTLFGGETIRTFTGALLVGIFSGTYSSIFNASMLLVIWERGELGLKRFNRDRTPDGRRETRELVRTRG